MPWQSSLDGAARHATTFRRAPRAGCGGARSTHQPHHQAVSPGQAVPPLLALAPEVEAALGQAVRWALQPEAAVQPLLAGATGPALLQEELLDRLQQGPVRWQLMHT